MRRQAKPFVTEYRGAARRTKDTGGDLHGETPRHRAYDEAQRMFQPDTNQPDFGEDSYDAALRAADALFAAPVQPARSEVYAPWPVEAQPWPERHWLPEEERSVSAHSEDPLPAASAAPRRILQAIEPPAEDRYAALEAERAPKRRGRKPGSKNKPKIVVGDDWLATVAVPSEPSGTATRSPVLPSIAVPVAFANDDLDESEIEGRTGRFMRKRDGLRPGERWKRRLPKAAW